jgi:hypothetical protein
MCTHVRMCVGAGCFLSCHHGLHVLLWLLAFVLWREDMCVGCTIGVAFVHFGVATFLTHDSTACCPRSSIRGLLFLALYALVFLCRCVHQAAQLDASPLLSALPVLLCVWHVLTLTSWQAAERPAGWLHLRPVAGAWGHPLSGPARCTRGGDALHHQGGGGHVAARQ